MKNNASLAQVLLSLLIDIKMKILFFLALLICNVAFAQNLYIADASESKLQISREEDAQKSCGTRSVIMYSQGTRAIDFSMSIVSPSTTAIKFGVFDFDAVSDEFTSLARQERLYLSSPSLKVNLVSEFPMQSDHENFTLAIIRDTASATKVLTEIAIGKTVEIQIPRKSESISTTVQFAAPIAQEDQLALIECLRNLQTKIIKDNNLR